MTVAPHRSVTNAVLAALRSSVGRPVGDAVKPTDDSLPYAVVYPAGRGALDGPVADQHADAAQVVQVTSIGETREQVEALSDRVCTALLGSVLVVPGRYVMSLELDGSQPARRDDDVRPALFYAVDLFRISHTPA